MDRIRRALQRRSASNRVVTTRRTAAELRRRGLRLEWATNVWNAMEVVVTIALGVQAGSLALIAFGLDSIVEIFASTVVIRNLHDDRHDPGDRRVHRALRLIALAFWTLATFLTGMSVRGLITSRSARQLSDRHRLPGGDGVRDVRTGATQTHNSEGARE